MYNFGKLTAAPKVFETTDDEGNVIDSVTVLAFYDTNGTLWHDLFRQHPHPFYIAVTDDDVILSMEDDPEQSQIAGCNIIGIDDDFGFTRGDNGTVYGKLWNGSVIMERPPTREELFPPLVKWRFEAMIDIYSQQNSVDLRGLIDASVEALPEPNRTVAKSKRQNVIEFYRADPLFDFIGDAVSMTPSQIDDLWLQAAAL